MELDAVIWTDELSEVPDLARAAERAGVAALWTSEISHNPMFPLVLAAEHTVDIKLGTAISVAFARSPTDMAQQAWDLARLSKGRFMLGLGTQVKAHVTRRFAMPWQGPPADVMRDYVGAMRAVWSAWQTGERLNHRGPYYKATLMAPFFDPGRNEQPDIPVFTAGVNLRMCRLAGEISDGFHAHPFHTRDYLEQAVLPAIDEGARRAGRARNDVEISSMVMVATGDRQEELDASVEEMRRQVSFYASTPTYGPVLEMHGWGAVGETLGRLAVRKRWDDMPEHISDEMLETFAIVAPWNRLPGLLQTKYDGLLDRITLYRPFAADDADRWSALSTALRSEAAAATGGPE